MVTLSEHLLQLPKRGGRYKLLLVTEQRHGILTTQKEQPLRIRWQFAQSNAIIVVRYSSRCEGDSSYMAMGSMLVKKRKSHILLTASLWLKKTADKQYADAEAVSAMLKLQKRIVFPLHCDNSCEVMEV